MYQEAASSSSLSSDTSNDLSTSSCDAELTEDALAAAQIDLVLEMTATIDAHGFQLPSKVSRKEVMQALKSCDGDVSRAVDEVLNLVAIKTLSQQDQQTLEQHDQNLQKHARLNISELCAGLGLNEDSSFVMALRELPESEQDDLLATNGAFVQQLLLCLDEGSAISSDAELVHPLQYLLELYPDYKADVVEDVLDSHNYDVNEAAEALHNLRALNNVQNFAAVLNADIRVAAQQKELLANGPKVDSFGQFPELGAASKIKFKRQQRKVEKLQQVPCQRPPPKPSPPPNHTMLPFRNHTANDKAKKEYNFWEYQDAPHDRSESRITTQLKLERLKKLLPNVDSSVIETTFYLNGCSSDATEAALREVYEFTLDEKQLLTPTAMKEAGITIDAGELAAASSDGRSRRSGRVEEWTLVSSKKKVNAAREALSNRYCDVLTSFRRGQHVLAVDRIRELSNARRQHRNAQRQWAHDFFLAHEDQIKHQQPIDLHGMIVMEALWVAREAIEYCQKHRIRRCILICGVGHHSINGKPRILTALQLSLKRRQIASRELNGVVTVFPLRSTESI